MLIFVVFFCNLCDKNKVVLRKTKCFSIAGSEGAAAFLSTDFTVPDLLLISWKNAGQCFTQQPWICMYEHFSEMHV